MTTQQQFLGRFAVGASNDSFSVDATAKTCTAGNYYITGYTGESTAQFCEHMEDLIAAVVASSTVVYSASTGLITITFGSGSHTITWTDSALKTLMGFDGVDTSVGAASFTAAMEPQYVWRPSRGLTTYPTQLNNVWEPESTTIVGRSKDGTTYSVVGNTLWRAELAYQMLPVAQVVKPSSTGTVTDFQSFFEDVCHAGQPIRFYPDRTLAASTSYATALFGNGKEDEPLGEWSRYCSRHVATLNTLWDVTLPLIKVVT